MSNKNQKKIKKIDLNQKNPISIKKIDFFDFY